MNFSELPAQTQETLRSLHDKMMRGRPTEAAEGFTQMRRDHPEYFPTYILLGRCLRRAGQHDRAAATFREAAAIKPDDPGVTLGLAWAALHEKQYDEARMLAERLSSDQARQGEALAVIAAAKEALGDREGAAAHYLGAYQAKPMWGWLEHHCRLLDRSFHSPSETDPLPWTLSPIERLWMFAFVENRLLSIAENMPNPPAEKDWLMAACDHTSRWTTAWAQKFNYDPVLLYQQLIGRGGICDCEVLLNSAKEDDIDHAALLLAGKIEGLSDALVDHHLTSVLEFVDLADPPSREDLDEEPAGLVAQRRNDAVGCRSSPERSALLIC